MKVKCEYCGCMIDDTAEHCPNCGAPNTNIKRTVDHTPKTIEELKQWYAARHLPPPEVTRFFIGVDYKEPKAFGIYKEGENCIVYKNKADGSRAVRYKGTDEAYAVNEIYLKLKSEILNQKAHNQTAGTRSGRYRENVASNSVVLKIGKWIGIVFLALCFFVAVGNRPVLTLLVAGIPAAAFFVIKLIRKKLTGKDSGGLKRFGIIYLIYLLIACIIITATIPDTSRASYYSYDDNVYANYGGLYYLYDPYISDYEPIDSYDVPKEIVAKPEDYEFDAASVQWDSSYSFENSDYYQESIKTDSVNSDNDRGYSYDYDNDSDWDWDSGDSWDFGGTDWDSDW